MRELKLTKDKLDSMEIQMESVTTALQTSTQNTELLISLVHSISHSLDTSKTVLLSAILDPPATHRLKDESTLCNHYALVAFEDNANTMVEVLALLDMIPSYTAEAC